MIIDFEYKTYFDFLNIFKAAYKDGYSKCTIAYTNEEIESKYLQTPTIEMVRDLFENRGYELLCLGSYLPRLKKTINPILITPTQSATDNVYQYRLVTFIGLPGEHDKIEITALYNFLKYIKDEALNNPTQKLTIEVNNYGTECKEKGFFRVIANNGKYEKKINEKIRSLINNEAVLQKWVDNIQETLEILKEYNMISEEQGLNLSPEVLMTPEEKEKYQTGNKKCIKYR